MIRKNILVYKSSAIRGVAVAAVIAASGCAANPKGVSDTTLATESVKQSCEQGCDDDELNRYQYYLGILSVALFG